MADRMNRDRRTAKQDLFASAKFSGSNIENIFSFGPMIQIKQIDVTKAGVKLFSDFSLDIPSDESWLIAGPNGSGKTVLLEVLAGILHLAHGEILYDFVVGETCEERYAEKRKNITYVPTNALQSFISGSEDLFYQQRYYGIGDQKVPLVKDLFERGS